MGYERSVAGRECFMRGVRIVASGVMKGRCK